MALLESIAFILYIRFAILLINIPRYDSFSYRLLQSMTMLLKQDKLQRIRTPTDGPLPAEYRRDLFLLFKEALHNLIRHSGATEAFIRLSVEVVDSNKTRLIVTVQDNGRGFDAGAVGPGGNGLRSMHRRAVSLGGTLRIETPGEGGTRLIFRGPVEGITFRSSAGVGVVAEIVS